MFNDFLIDESLYVFFVMLCLYFDVWSGKEFVSDIPIRAARDKDP